MASDRLIWLIPLAALSACALFVVWKVNTTADDARDRRAPVSNAALLQHMERTQQQEVAKAGWVVKGMAGCDEDMRQSVSIAVIKQKLRSPSTAKFNYLDGKHGTMANGDYTYSNYVDSQNGFGAMVRSHYIVQLACDHGGLRLVDYRIE